VERLWVSRRSHGASLTTDNAKGQAWLEIDMANRNDAKRRRLGRGLSSLLAEPVEVPGDAAAPPPPPAADTPAGIAEIAIDSIRPNPSQPRQHFDDEALDELAQSIRSAGLMQPVVVRPSDHGFELVAGERRWRAVRRLGLDRIPAIVRDVDEATAAQWAVIENVQREDLNAIERAEAFRRLINEFGLSQQDVAGQVGLQRSTVSNHLRLLELSDEVQHAVRDGEPGRGRRPRGVVGAGDGAAGENRLKTRLTQRQRRSDTPSGQFERP
jgi:ParB family chromosome partitioning protein